jgi:hypothetical protein
MINIVKTLIERLFEPESGKKVLVIDGYGFMADDLTGGGLNKKQMIVTNNYSSAINAVLHNYNVDFDSCVLDIRNKFKERIKYDELISLLKKRNPAIEIYCFNDNSMTGDVYKLGERLAKQISAVDTGVVEYKLKEAENIK